MSDRYLHTRRSSFKSMHCAKSAVEHGPCENESKKQNQKKQEFEWIYSTVQFRVQRELRSVGVCARCMFIHFFNILSPLKEQRSLHN